MAVKINNMLEPTQKSQADSRLQEQPGDAFEALFRTHWKQVCGLLYRLVGDPDEAEDLALEAFWRLYRSFDLGAPHQNPGGWLYRAATFLGYNALRARSRRIRYEEEAGIQVLESSAEGNPAHEAERRLEGEQVRRVLARLKPRTAQILVMRHSGMSYNEISDALGVRLGSVGTLLARAEKEFENRYRKLEGSAK